MNEKTTDHIPVLLTEVIELLNPQPHKTYLDVTFGCGGHTQAILEKDSACSVIALDYDKDTLEKYGKPLQEKYGNRLRLIWGSFGHLYLILKREKIKQVDGILADFGTSQYQIFSKEGYSFQRDTPLDMRASKSHYYITAAHALNTFSQKQLEDIFFRLGEEPYSKKIAAAIVRERLIHSFNTTYDLAHLIEKIVPLKRDNNKRFKTHPATKIFQALRIFVNQELENITHFLPAAVNALTPGAPLLCITFHSLEDRIVKTFFQKNKDHLEILTKKPITATAFEIAENPSSRSAKLRVAKKPF